MKKILFLLFIAILLYAAILFTPVGIFLFQTSSLEFSDTSLYEQLTALASITVVVNVGDSEEPSAQIITVTLTEEDLERVLTAAFRKQENPFVRIHLAHVEISPDMVMLEISYHYGWGEYRPFETTIFTHWLVDIFPPPSAEEQSHRIGVRPVVMYTNHLYSVNLAQIWPYLTNTSREDPWLLLPVDAQIQIEDLRLLEQELALSLVW